MDWKAQIASSIEAAVQASVEAALQRSRYAPVEESADETARRRTSWFGEAGRRRIELAEDRARRDPVWAEKMARRHAAFRDALASTAAPARTATAGAASAQLEPDLSTSMPGTAASTSTAPPSVLTACAVCAGNLAARLPTTCSTKCPGRAAVVPELAAPAVSDKAFDVDAMCDTTRSAAVCLPAGPDHNICGEDLVSKSLTLCSAPTYFSSLPGNPPSSTCEPTDVLEPFMWSFTSCSTIRSGHSLKMPPSLMPEAYMEFSIGPNVSRMAPWPPPSCTRAGPSLIFRHDLCHNEQQKRSEEFSVMDSKENWNAIWLRVELKPPWLSRGVSTNLPVGWPDPPWPPPTPNKSTACKNFSLHSTLNIRLTSGDWQVFKTMELNLWLALLVSMFVPEVHSAHLQPLVCKWSVPFWYDTILLMARTTLNMKLDLLLTKRTTNTVWNWCCLDNLYAYLGSPNWALEEEQGQVFLRMSWQWFRYHWEAAYPMKPCSAIPFMFGKPPTGQPHLHGYDGNSILHYTNFSDENQLHVLVVLETFRSELFSVGYIWDCLQYEHLQQWRPPDQTTEFPEHWLIPWDPGEVLVQHLLNKTRPRVPISVSRAVDMTFPYVLVLEQQFHASWDPGGSNSRLFDDSPGHNLIEKFSSLSITCELQYSSSVVDSLLAARYWVWCMRCLQLDIDRPSKCVSNFQLKPPWSHFSSTIPTRFRLPEAYILLVDVEHGNNKDMNSWYDPLPSLGHVQFSLHCLFGTVQNPNGIMSTTSCLEVHILDAISISLSTSTLMHVGKFCLLLGQFSSCDQFVPESATDLGSQLFEWQIPWYSGLCSAIFSSNWLQMQPVGGHLKFNVDITSTIDSMPSIKHVSGMFSVALQYWEVVNYFAAAMLLMSSQLSEGWVLYLPVTCIMQCRSELMPWVLANSRDGILTYTKRVLIFQDPGGSVLVLHAGTGVNGNSSQQPFLLLTWDPGGYMQHRLEGKPNLKEGGMLATIPYYRRGLHHGPALLGLACSRTTGASTTSTTEAATGWFG